VLAHLCRRVYTIERYRTLMREAEERFQKLALTNITTRVADGARGWPEQAPFDRIILTAAAEILSQVLIEQLKPDGVMVLPMGGPQEQWLMRVRRTGEGVREEELLPVRFVPLVEGMARET
jgi:protein-L-isoaspartate(D-aspartate) O-methyltransferase